MISRRTSSSASIRRSRRAHDHGRRRRLPDRERLRILGERLRRSDAEKDASGNNIDPVLGIFEYEGLAPDKIVPLEFPKFTITTRALDKDTLLGPCAQRLRAARQEDEHHDEQRLLQRVHAMGSPTWIGKDERQRYVYNTNYAMIVDEQGTIPRRHCGDVTSICGNIVCGGP